LEYVLDLADDVSSRDKSPGPAVAAVVAVITQDKVVAIGYPARQALRRVSTIFLEWKRPYNRYGSRRLGFDSDSVLTVAEAFQILEGGGNAISVNVITDSPDGYLFIVDLESLVGVRNSVTWKTDYPFGDAQGFIFGKLEDDYVSSSHLG